MEKKWTTQGLGVAFMLGVLSLSSAGFALDSWLTRAETKYPFIVGTRIDNCGLCHTDPNNPDIGNVGDFGNSYLNDGGASSTGGFGRIEDLDADGDGYSNLEEFFARTFPGDGGDTPAPPANQVDLIPAGTSWKYLDNGTDQGTAWRGTGFSDTAWLSKLAQLGYGNIGEASVVSYGPSSTAKYVTTYFRSSFNKSASVSYSNAVLRVLRNDGVVVYLNGVELLRSNMPTGTVAYNTLASSQTDAWVETPFNASLLAAGTNVFAVETHLNAVNGANIAFKLQLQAQETTVTPTPGTVQFKSATYSVAENGASVQLLVSRTGGSFGAASVNYATANGTATAGSDYTANSGMLSWADGDAADKAIDVLITNDSVYEGNETFGATLSGVSGATLGTPTQTTVTISNDDAVPPTGSLQFKSATYSVAENGASVQLLVSRTGGSFGAASVNYATANGTATAGSDYTAKSGTLSWANGDAADKAIDVLITNDSVYEGNETFAATLSGAGGAALGTPTQTTVTIVEDDASPLPGSVQFKTAAYSVAENGASVQILVSRTGGSFGAASVNYATGNGTATAGSDYTAKSGTLSWANGDAADKAIDVLITNDSVYEGNETFGATLSGAGGATLGTPSQTTVTIADDEASPVPTGIWTDYNGDGRDDLFVKRSNGNAYVYLMNAGGAGYTSPWGLDWDDRRLLGVGDFNGDGRDDMLVENDSRAYVWLIKPDGVGFTVPYSMSWRGYTLLGVGDFDGDGRDDLFAKRSNGYAYVCLMKAGGTGYTTPWSLAWDDRRLLGVGDFNGDGRDDLFFRRSNGNAYVCAMKPGGAGYTSAYGFLWGDRRLLSVGDYDGDGRDDLFVKRSNGSAYAYLMKAGGAGYTIPWSLDWEERTLLGVGDFNGDGRDDLFFKRSNGYAYVCAMKPGGLGYTSVYSLPWSDRTLLSVGGVNPTRAAARGEREDGEEREDSEESDDGERDLESDRTRTPSGSDGESTDDAPKADGAVRSSSVGDVNGDGRGDFLQVVPGSGATSAEVDLLLGTDAGSSVAATFLPEEAGDDAGRDIGPAGDVNGDGLADFYIGATSPRQPGSVTVKVYLLHGRAKADWGRNFNLSGADAHSEGPLGHGETSGAETAPAPAP